MSYLSMNALETGLRAVQAEAAGVMTVVIVHPSEGPALLASAMAGNREARHLFQSVVTTLENIARASKRKPLLCATCPRPLRKAAGFSIAVALPAKGDPARGICLAVCARCASENDPGAVTAQAMKALAAIWPDLRPITITHKSGGRA